MMLTHNPNLKTFTGNLGYGQYAFGNYSIGAKDNPYLGNNNNASGVLFNGNAPIVPTSTTVCKPPEKTEELEAKMCSMQKMLHTLIDRGAPASEEYNHLIEHEVCHYMNAFVNDNENIISYLFRKENYDELICRINDLQEQQESGTHDECLSLVYKSIAVAQKAYQIKTDLTQQVKSLKDKLQAKQGHTTYTQIEITTPHIEYEMDMFVVQYIIRYGMPNKGIFDPQKYAALKKELDNKPMNEWDWTVRKDSKSDDSCSQTSDSCCGSHDDDSSDDTQSVSSQSSPSSPSTEPDNDNDNDTAPVDDTEHD